MAYKKIGPDSVGRIVEQPLIVGNLVRLPNRALSESVKTPRRMRRARQCRILEFCPAPPLTKFERNK